MSTTNDGGPAFPLSITGDSMVEQYGMTLRDYFAAKAIGLAYFAEKSSPTGSDGEPTYSGIAMRAYLLADAMLKARGQP